MPFIFLFAIIFGIYLLLQNIWFWYAIGGLAILAVGFVAYAIWWSNTPQGKEEAEEAARRKMIADQRRQLPADFGDGPRLEKKKSGIAIDEQGKKVAIFDNAEWSQFEFSDILGADLEVKENDTVHTTSSRSLVGAAIGGLTFGPAGAVIGGLGGKAKSTTNTTLEDVVLKIMVRDMTKPIREVQFGVWTGITASWVTTDREVSTACEWLARIKMIVDENGRISSLAS
jgi:hypothetical protein